MSIWPQVTYVYDGSFAGFLTCISESFQHREYPFYFFLSGDEQYSLYPLRLIDSDSACARKLYLLLKAKISLQARQLATYAFLTCLPQKERHIYDFIYANVYKGPLLDPTDDRVLILSNAVRHLTHEAHMLQGFLRFSDFSHVLVGEITPKNRVLPLLRSHFCDRFAKESFLIYDRTHKEALCYSSGIWRILPLETLSLQEPEIRELETRKLWRNFYSTVAIESRFNPKLQMSKMPKRYRENMTEFQ
ncbi:MAG: metabolism protein [Evtepia sp.]|jgi:probable DNA metabolism protein|nr:metabolism protein [Evtepia sp.]